MIYSRSILSLICLAIAFIVARAGSQGPLSEYLPAAVAHANQRIEDAINPVNKHGVKSTRGSLQAALSGTCPDYEFTWTRDQALVFNTILEKYEIEPAGAERQKHEQMLKDFAAHTNTIYQMNSGWHTDVNHPSHPPLRYWDFADAKYEMNGQMYLGSWCSPQNDGPALRAMVLMRFAKKYAEYHPHDSYIETDLYSNSLGKGIKNPIKRDLEYIYHRYDIENCEPWEEVRGKHFYNRMMARRAMVMGQEFAKTRDPGASVAYGNKVNEIHERIMSHWLDDRHTIATTRDKHGNIVYDRLDDIQTVLATLHSYSDDDQYFSATGDFVLANALYTLNSFKDYYTINHAGKSPPQLGIAIGRYRGDIYNGGNECPANKNPAICPNCKDQGQPWFLATNAMGELFFKAAKTFLNEKKIVVNKYNVALLNHVGGRQHIEHKTLPFTIKAGQSDHAFEHLITSLLHTADSFLKRTQYHTDDKYKLDEQYNRETGKMMSAGDLTWSYASLVTANNARDKVNPVETIKSFTPNDGMVDVEVIVTNVPKGRGQVVVVGDTPELGMGDVCKGGKLFWKRDINEKGEWSGFVRVPKDKTISFRAYSVDSASCRNNVEHENGPLTKFTTQATNPLDAVHDVWTN